MMISAKEARALDPAGDPTDHLTRVGAIIQANARIGRRRVILTDAEVPGIARFNRGGDLSKEPETAAVAKLVVRLYALGFQVTLNGDIVVSW